ncbi:MAG: HAMP domain-containing histidine kinase, partial [Flavobacteriales bacterium]|nr:HAMP domain-containing histidine kinase [Flavobacteriales bacterium]
SGNPFGVNKTLNFLYSGEGISSYLAKIKVKAGGEFDYYLFIELFPKLFSKAKGYPELLLDKKNVISQINTNQYSYAKYRNGKLVDNLGKFNYSVELGNQYKFDGDGFCTTTFGKAYHVIYQSDKFTTIILSSPQKTMFNYITTFSYFFIISSLLILLVGYFLKISPFNWQLAMTDFSTKIQIFIIVSIFLSFILFGWATTYYIKKQNAEKNNALLAEKVQSVLIELEDKLGDRNKLEPKMYDELTYYLIKFSNVFYTDINLYSKEGRLLASSRPEVFDRGMTGTQMDAEAFNAIHSLKKTHFTQNERIGSLNYLSTYVPFRNDRNEILAYMNLPYFAKQDELDNELSSFYTALVNVYGLLFLITAIIAVFFANYISEPVRLIKDKISALQLGKSYDLLEWQSNDEIGALVIEYNKKVMELEKSAQLLVQSERESAWREMAKQVAHEIKNPLTPMKLSIQQLQRLANDNTEDLAERIDRTSKTLIEQIDTLTKIANEFSNFAKMPKANEQVVDLIPLLETAIDLYKEEGVAFQLRDNSRGDTTIVADKDQVSRVFTNLIKNAIQAIPEDRDGKIEITVGVNDSGVLLQVQDNGMGIPDDKKDKIFVPNFTTKSTGMGLGLAMVKNIVEQANGKIWFETKEQEGTTFFIQFERRAGSAPEISD